MINQEKFVNTYVKLLNEVMLEGIQKNVVLQSQKKVLEEELENEKSKDSIISTMKIEHEKQLRELKEQLNEARFFKESTQDEFGELKKTVKHVETFRVELIREREKNEKLSERIIELEKELEAIKNQSTKRKSKKQFNEVETVSVTEFLNNDIVKDAGNF